MPYDWLFELEAHFIRLIPAYTLETLDNCDIDRLLPYYFFHYRKALQEQKAVENKNNQALQRNKDENIVIRNGKKYHKVKAGQASWADKIF